MKTRFINGNTLQLLTNGAAYFMALEQAIDTARNIVPLETYIFADDETGRRIAAALTRAAKRGVTVRVLVDGFGSNKIFDIIRRQLLSDKVQVLIYHPKISPFTMSRNRLRRLHRKLVMIDCHLAFIGGINIIDDMNSPGDLPTRYDYAVRIEGPLLGTLVRENERLWNRIALLNFKLEWRIRPLPIPQAVASGKQRAALVVRDNLRHRFDIEDAYLDAINRAQKEIIIVNAYFFPGKRFRRTLRLAAGRGVRVILLLQGRMEYALLHYASRALYGAFLDAGVEIYNYRKSLMHAKVGVIDGQWSTVGSSNIDPFSLLLAREANVIVDDSQFAEELHASLRQHIEDGALKVDQDSWYGQPLWRRIINWSAYGVARLLLGLAGLRSKSY
ncbi:phosphatidylserine/phosphatidylglycerophosphate/cardiolipin synthase [Desulfocapsa sulfexigens DSM 10523]|uniref:Phosphatidylserine/phosphatidylglycerophosphate/ cardiolipin synthase n=1 Tax=Desulfocapsa sulfexigens (strain DSM 10523 / SB164P1) TaxID=1167006 RepID=M1NCS0_DESSD|nr:cardiolipin synthase ClsB [Desulfocapsa sulfexigens]AGF77539.1 phosphatidylserine/phosphatidylglycerophosphate/cardiolipin synthase [Desulfocapsa sulfexigens DSM 10523]